MSSDWRDQLRERTIDCCGGAEGASTQVSGEVEVLDDAARAHAEDMVGKLNAYEFCGFARHTLELVAFATTPLSDGRAGLTYGFRHYPLGADAAGLTAKSGHGGSPPQVVDPVPDDDFAALP